MTFNISEFSSEMAKRSVADTDLFKLQINNVPLTLQSEISPRELQFFCRTVDIPSLNIATREQRDQGFGLMQRMPSELNLPAMATVFMVDSSHNVLKFFHRWIQSIVNFDVSAGPISSVGGMLPNEFAYPEDYEVDITLEVYSKDNPEHCYRYTFYRCYPTDIGSITMAWEQTNSIMLLPVTFTFEAMESDGMQPGSVQFGDGRGIGLFDRITNAIGSTALVSGLSLPLKIQDIINSVTTLSHIKF